MSELEDKLTFEERRDLAKARAVDVSNRDAAARRDRIIAKAKERSEAIKFRRHPIRSTDREPSPREALSTEVARLGRLLIRLAEELDK